MTIFGRGAWLLLALAVAIADRATKYAIERYTDQGFRRGLVPHFADLVHSQNQGIAFGMLSESGAQWLSLLLIASAVLMVLLLAWFLLKERAGGRFTQAGFALIAGGATGNVLDRVLYGGVTDFLELRAGRFVWPAFNLADAAITVGAVLVGLELLRDARNSTREHV